MNKLKKAALIVALTAVTYVLAHHQATMWRGYEAIGGELLIWILPAAVWAVKHTVADWARDIMQNIKK